jgi:hypothetical protein
MAEFMEVVQEERMPQTAIIELTKNDLLTMPRELIPAPGEDAILQVISAGMLFRYGTRPIMGIVQIDYEGGLGANVTGEVDLNQMEDTLFFCPPLMSFGSSGQSTYAYPLSVIANKAIVLTAVTPITGGNNAVVRINLLYRLLGLWIP